MSETHETRGAAVDIPPMPWRTYQNGRVIWDRHDQPVLSADAATDPDVLSFICHAAECFGKLVSAIDAIDAIEAAAGHNVNPGLSTKSIRALLVPIESTENTDGE